MKKSQQHINLRMSSKTSVLNTSTHIKTPIMSRIVTKPKEWQVRPAIVAGLTNLTIPQTVWVLVRLLGCDIM